MDPEVGPRLPIRCCGQGTVSDLNLLDCISQQLADVSHLFLEDMVHEHPEIFSKTEGV